MKEIMLTKGKVALVDDEDYEFLNKWKWNCDMWGYVRRHGGKDKTILMHRVIMNTPNGKFTDHINRNKLDNRRSNLRICDGSQNNMNTRIRINNTSGSKGVLWYPRNSKWLAQIKYKGKQIYLGLFEDKGEAVAAYTKKANEIYGEFVNEALAKLEEK